MAKKTFNLYLARREYTEFEQLLSENAKARLPQEAPAIPAKKIA